MPILVLKNKKATVDVKVRVQKFHYQRPPDSNLYSAFSLNSMHNTTVTERVAHP